MYGWVQCKNGKWERKTMDTKAKMMVVILLLLEVYKMMLVSGVP